jgi:hypothetical protein
VGSVAAILEESPNSTLARTIKEGPIGVLPEVVNTPKVQLDKVARLSALWPSILRDKTNNPGNIATH